MMEMNYSVALMLIQILVHAECSDEPETLIPLYDYERYKY